MSDTKTMREALSAAIEAIEADWMANEGRPPYPHELALELMRHPVIHRIQAKSIRDTVEAIWVAAELEDTQGVRDFMTRRADRIVGVADDEPERYELFPGINNALDKLTIRRGA